MVKGVCLAVDPSVVNQTGVADGSSGDQDGHNPHLVVDHFSPARRAHRVSLALSVHLNAHHQSPGWRLAGFPGKNWGWYKGRMASLGRKNIVE